MTDAGCYASSTISIATVAYATIHIAFALFAIEKHLTANSRTNYNDRYDVPTVQANVW